VAAGTWTIAARLLAQATAGASVRLRFRFWRSANADGSAATQITTGPIIGSTVTVDADGEISSGAEAGLGEVTFAGEYLFVQVACETV
jgi:hypothetical protein